jgi:predicted DCC family thiol-disulfide oxidoreductase YuxK
VNAPVVPLVLFDGVCGLCDRIVRAILSRDRAGRFHFAALQSDLGQRLLTEAGLATGDFDTLVLIDATGQVRLRSDAALGILAELPRWRWTRVARCLPRGARDAAYRWIARRRHRLFPPPAACAVPPPEWRRRVLE